MKAVMLDGETVGFGERDWSELTKYCELTWYDKTEKEALLSRCDDVEAIFTNKAILDKTVLDRLTKLKYIGLLATGSDNIDIVTAKEKGIVVCNVPAYSTFSVAQHVFALLFSVTNQVKQHDDSVKQGVWIRSKHFSYWLDSITELKDKVMGLVGFGHIAQSVAQIALALGMEVIAYTPRPKQHRQVRFVSKSFLFEKSDVISLHCPLNPDTNHLINETSLSTMKASAILINTGRGGLIDEQALSTALKSNQIKAACLDVLSHEPPSTDQPLIRLKNCIITPHIAWASAEARHRLMNQVIENFASFTRGETINKV